MPFASASIATDRPAQRAERLASRLAESADATVHTSADGRITAELPAGSCVIAPHGSRLEVHVAASDVDALAVLEGAVGAHLAADAEPGDTAEPRVEWSAPATADDTFEPLHPVVADYVLTHSTASDALLSELAVETRLQAGDAAGMQISHDEGTLLTMLVRLVGARNAVEVGTFTGYSSICIARGLADGGRLLACDVSERWTAIARRYWERAGVADRIELKIAPALETLRALPKDETIDFAFIDADKESYPAYYEELVTRLRPGGCRRRGGP